MIQPTLITYILINAVKNFTVIHFSGKLDRRVGRCNTLNDLSNKVYVPNETEGLNLKVFKGLWINKKGHMMQM